MKRFEKRLLLLLTAGVLLQFGGCLEAVLADVFFAVGPLFL